MTNQRRLVLVGCGRWGRLILTELLDLGVAMAVVDSDPSVTGKLVDVRTLTALDRDLPEHDGVIVATPASTHTAVLNDLLDLTDRPIYVEKPFTTAADEARELAERAPDRLFVMHTWRHHPAIGRLREIIESGVIGDVTTLSTTRCNWTSPRTDVDPLWTLLPHDYSIGLELLGTVPEPWAVQVERVDHRNVSASVLGRLGERPMFTATVSTRFLEKRREIRIHGTDGVAVFAGDDADAIVVGRGWDPEPVVESHPVRGESALRRELQAFLDHLDGGPPPASSARDSASIVSAVERTIAMGAR